MKKFIAAIVITVIALTGCTLDGSHSSTKGCELVRRWPKEMADYYGPTDSWYLWVFDEDTPGHDIVKIVTVTNSPYEDTCWIV